MAEYIDRDAAKKIIKKHMTKTANEFKNKDYNTQSIIRKIYLIAIDHAIEFLSIIPAADVAEVKHGEFEKVHPDSPLVNKYRCSVCNAERMKDNYCPNCGAKMDGKETLKDE